jgi:hypothetical protein
MLYLGISLIILSVILFASSYLLKEGLNTGDKTKEDCEKDNNTKKEGDKCGNWDNNLLYCRKGIIVGNGAGKDCVSKGRMLPLIFLVFAPILFIAGIIVLFVKKH